jgi:hypothetical protein
LTPGARFNLILEKISNIFAMKRSRVGDEILQVQRLPPHRATVAAAAAPYSSALQQHLLQHTPQCLTATGAPQERLVNMLADTTPCEPHADSAVPGTDRRRRAIILLWHVLSLWGCSI